MQAKELCTGVGLHLGTLGPKFLSAAHESNFSLLCPTGGAASTLFWVDIEEDVQVLFFTQYMAPGNLPFLSRLLQFVYSALDSSPGPGPSVQSAL